MAEENLLRRAVEQRKQLLIRQIEAQFETKEELDRWTLSELEAYSRQALRPLKVLSIFL